MAGRLYKQPHLLRLQVRPQQTRYTGGENERYGKIRDGGVERKLPPLNTAINQLAGANRCSPPSLAGWQHSGVIKIVTIDKSRWMEHFPPVLLGSLRVIIFVWLIHTEDRKVGARVCARADAASLKANLRAWPSGGRAESNAAGQSPASKHPSHSVTFHYQRVILIKETVKGVKWLGRVWNASKQTIIKMLM